MTPARHAARTVTVLGAGQIFAWGATYYLPAVLARPIAQDTGWPLTWIVGALSLGTLVSGLAAPAVGRRIDRIGGRPVLAASAAMFAVGLGGLAIAPGLLAYLACWLLLGLGMAAGLYDAAFGTLGRLYGQDARRHITVLTLFGGFASTVCWPLSAWLVAEVGWRGACLAYACLHLCLVLPAYLWLLPRQPAGDAPAVRDAGDAQAAPDTDDAAARAKTGQHRRFLLLAASGALTAAIGAVVAVHLLALLQGRGISLAAAVALGALVGPAQVGARLVEMLLGRYHHPVWTMAAAALLMFTGTALLYGGGFSLAVALVLYGAGMGIHSIARGAVPLALFGAAQYASMMGRLARPGAIIGALAPTLVAMLWAATSDGAVLLALGGCTALNVLVVGVLLLDWRRSAPAGADR
jgi:MFS family permease